MLFQRVKSAYKSSVMMTFSRPADFIMDTGSPFTTMSIELLCKVIRCKDVDLVRKELLSYGFIEAVSYTKHMVRMVPVYIRNARVDGTLLDKFYCFVNVDMPNSTSLIGTDFISACTVSRTEASYAFEFSCIDEVAYENNFKALCHTDNIHEIFELTDVKEKKSSLSFMFNSAAGGRLDYDRSIV